MNKTPCLLTYTALICLLFSASVHACPGGSCGTNGAHGILPMPEPKFVNIDTTVSTLCKGLGPGISTDGNNNISDLYRTLRTETVNGVCKYFDEGGKHIYISDAQFTAGNNSASIMDGGTITRTQDTQSTSLWDYTITETDGTVYQLKPILSSISNTNNFIDCVTRQTDPNGRVTTYTRDTNGNLTSVTTPEGDTWGYTTDSTSGRITSVTAPDGTSTTISYNTTFNEVASITTYSPSGSQIDQYTYTYDTNGRITQATHGSQALTYAYTIDTTGKITAITVTDTSATPNIETIYGYNGETTTITKKHPTDTTKDQTTTYKYFMYGALRNSIYSVTDPYGNITKNGTYVLTGVTLDGDQNDCITTDNENLIGKAFRVTDPNGNITSYTYDTTNGNLLTTTYPDGSTVTNTYYPRTSYIETYKDVRGNYAHYVRDTSNLSQLLAIKVSAPINGSEPTDWSTIPDIKEYAYYPSNDPHGQGGLLQQTTVPNIDGTTASVTSYQYYETVNGTEKHRTGPTVETYQYWDTTANAYTTKTTQTSYDSMGRMISTTDANGRTVTYAYDVYGHQTGTTYAQGVYTASNYDCCSLLWSQDENGHQTHYAYDADKRPTDTWTDTSGQSQTAPLVHYAYDSFGNASTVTTRSDATTTRTTSYTYDNMNRVVRIDYPSPLGYEAFGYDAMGNQQWKRDGNGNITLYKYDNLNRLTDIYYNYTGSLSPITYPTRNADVSYTYDSGSNLKTAMTERNNTGTTVLHTSTYTYDTQNRLTSYGPPAPVGHGAVTYTYNNLGQKTGITSNNYNVVYNYYANGWLKNVVKGGQTIATYTYDPAGNRTRTDYGNQTWQTFTYDTDPRYRLYDIHYGYRCTDTSNITDQGGLRTIRDNAGNPTSWGTIDGTYERAYTYDLNNRLSSETYPNQPLTSDTYDWVGNKLSLNGATYNAADQLTSMNGHAYTYDANGNMASDNATQYTYTPNNLLSTAGNSSMTWDDDGNMAGFTSSADVANSCTFIHDVINNVPSVIEEIYKNICTCYVRDPFGFLIARTNGKEMQYYAFDDLGNTMFLTGDSGTVTDKYVYDAWGRVTSHAGSTNQPYQYVGQAGYYTYYQNANLSLVQIGIRCYDPCIGRFVQIDPDTQSVNWYLYADNNPVAYLDSFGLTSMKKMSCSELADAINKRYNEVGRRLRQLREDAGGLRLICSSDLTSLSDLGTWDGHVKQLKDKQKNLRDLLQEYATKGCGRDSKNQIPKDAWGKATAKVPTPMFKMNKCCPVPMPLPAPGITPVPELAPIPWLAPIPAI